ncbi:Copper amine oxidase N-terminal domain-containing protein [Paenibacillus sophorae]|uniref:Copper amine oxidase N-terminal domain-containing protein n=1 Tax=Paenibacillus sophorae TaxID=1333845 RepID=A0A1H8N3W6_9BACL|nr:copper amine oxidase N-terminal domain-containing protein [Paenibacillus sophorae]QWU14801.1 copper amine oxidase N-terminal domain-containing protein [Paenibacillus sophorae]SEO24153.1 Copper amine oxidase N-terminal domain-containing protein [Paenibacillus sophorae]
MNVRKLALIAVLTVAQAASAIPAFAESATQIPAGTAAKSAVANTVSSASPKVAAAATAITGTVSPAPTTSPSPTASPSASALPSSTVEGSPAVEQPGVTPQPSASGSPLATPQPTATSPVPIPASVAGAGQLVLMMNSNKMYLNGVQYLAGQPMAVKNGVSNVAIRAMVERVGLKLTYNGATKETIIMKDGNELRFKTNSKIYTVNGRATTMKGPAYQYKNTFMVPLTSITQALGIPYTVDNVQKRVILTLQTKPKASFTVQPAEIFAGETTVNYVTSSTASNGATIVNERWEGRQDIFEQPGYYTVSYSVMDSNGQWSDPYSVTINVLKPNQPPVAQFTTNKDEYKMGEPVTITNISTDPDGDQLTESWSNRALAFFNPGPVSIQLTVTDTHGLSSTFEKTINITNEVLYSQEDFNKLFVPLGDIYTINGSEIPSWSKIAYTTGSEPVTLIRSNSPETVYSEGIVYQETAMGDTRLMVHHKNSMSTNMKMYVIATNNNIYPATITTQRSGFGGPLDIPTATGKKSIETYFQSIQSSSAYSNVTLQPGESKAVLTTINNVTMKPGQIISLMSDVFSDYPVKYSVIMIDATKDPLLTLPTLGYLDRDGVHNRGTYSDANRIITVTDPVGATPSRLVIGDNNSDPNLPGTDALTGTVASNAGNFGVVYKITLTRVAPNTLITLNPRGGKYQGPLLVNGGIIQAPNAGAVDAPNQNSVLYRTGNLEQTVEIMFTAASGSNLPVNLLFMPLPAQKAQ